MGNPVYRSTGTQRNPGGYRETTSKRIPLGIVHGRFHCTFAFNERRPQWRIHVRINNEALIIRSFRFLCVRSRLMFDCGFSSLRIRREISSKSSNICLKKMNTKQVYNIFIDIFEIEESLVLGIFLRF